MTIRYRELGLVYRLKRHGKNCRKRKVLLSDNCLRVWTVWSSVLLSILYKMTAKFLFLLVYPRCFFFKLDFTYQIKSNRDRRFYQPSFGKKRNLFTPEYRRTGRLKLLHAWNRQILIETKKIELDSSVI